ncbi:hypothetical protein GALMADRAFT_148995 [Galerina marginata CBS 339.88]|uniref:Uncharacterized protein n=1 Tax=Galerina marginata (strain CBS 339.88) TaxID=685588 RepID=A0A067S5D4_GALM3|nr:hypothetical protein GALMADRAFT_148995 [Galerina marginata CBS 339.88]
MNRQRILEWESEVRRTNGNAGSVRRQSDQGTDKLFGRSKETGSSTTSLCQRLPLSSPSAGLAQQGSQEPQISEMGAQGDGKWRIEPLLHHEKNEGFSLPLLVQRLQNEIDVGDDSMGLDSLPDVELTDDMDDRFLYIEKQEPAHRGLSNLVNSDDENDSMGLDSDLPQISSSFDGEDHFLYSHVPRLITQSAPDPVYSNNGNDSMGLDSDLPEINSGSDEEDRFLHLQAQYLTGEAGSIMKSYPISSNSRRLKIPVTNNESYRSPGSLSSIPSTRSMLSYRPQSAGKNGHVTAMSFNEPEVQMVTDTNILQRGALMGDPWFWGRAWNGLRVMNDDGPIPIEVIDLYLLSCWHDLREASSGTIPNCYYIDERTAREISKGSQSVDLREILLVTRDLPLQRFPVLTILKGNEAGPGPAFPLLLLLNYELNQVIVLGWNQKEENRWIDSIPEWMRVLWRKVGESLGWMPSLLPTISAMNWITVEDFGTSVVSLFSSVTSKRWVWENGMYRIALKPELGCPHAVKQCIFATVLGKCTQYGQYWRVLRASKPDWMSPGQDLVGDLDIGFKSFSWVQHHSIRLLNTMRTCSKCCPTQVTSTEITSKQDAASLASSEDTDKIREYNIRPTPRVSAIAIPCEDLSDTADDEILLGDYDDYASSPIESWDDDRLLGIWTFQNGQTILPSCWTVWKDRGYRLPKNFFNTLPLRPPSGHHEHFLPFLTGIDDPDPTEADHASDCLMLSARQMLDEAGQIPGTAESLRVFVKGVERSQDRKERFIKIDLNADAYDVGNGC